MLSTAGKQSTADVYNSKRSPRGVLYNTFSMTKSLSMQVEIICSSSKAPYTALLLLSFSVLQDHYVPTHAAA